MDTETAPVVSQGLHHESTLGQSYVGLAGLIAITIYLVFVALSDFYITVKIWPPDPLPGVSTNTQPSPGTSTNPAPNPPSSTQSITRETAPIKWQLDLFWCDNEKPKTACWISLNTALFLIAMLSGALGSLLHSLRSLYWYTGNRRLVWSWAIMYMLLPFSGAVLATIFYIIIRAGFLPSSGGTQTIPNTPYGFAALGALVGLFSEEAVLKLKQVAETVFARTPAGKDHAAPPPKLSSVSPNSGPVAGGTVVTIAGTDFAAGAKVNIGGVAVSSITSINANSISATTPAHPAGDADLEVVNADGQKGVLAGAYKYV